MYISIYFLIALLVAAPVLSLAYEIYAQPVALLLIAPLLACTAMSASSTELAILKQAVRVFSLVLLLPIFWMIVQVAPVPKYLANAIWSMAAIALNDSSLAGHVSVNPSASLFGLTWYIAVLAVGASVILIAKDRRRAEAILITLTILSTLITLAVLVVQLEPRTTAAAYFDLKNASSLTLMSTLAALANGAIIAMAIERNLNHGEAMSSIARPESLQVLFGLCGILIAGGTTVLSRRGDLLVVTGLSFGLLLFVAFVRRLNFQPWLAVMIAASFMMAIAAASLPLLQSLHSIDVVRFAGSASAASAASARLAIADSPWLGSGVGTFAEVARVYADVEHDGALKPPSSAVSVVIEWGAPALPIFAVSALFLFFILLHGAIARGRDSFFATLGAASVLSIFCSSLLDAGLLTQTVQLFFAVILGLAIAQSAGRTTSI